MQAQACPPNSPSLLKSAALWLPIGLTAISILVNAGIGVLIYWYTRETRALRIQGEKQLDLLKQQRINSISPFILPSVSSSLDIKYADRCENLSENLALNVRLFLFEAKSRCFVRGSTRLPYQKAGSGESFHGINYAPADFAGFTNELQQTYPANVIEPLKQEVEKVIRESGEGSNSIVMAIYTDAEGNHYFVYRPFEVDRSNNTVHGAAVRIGPIFPSASNSGPSSPSQPSGGGTNLKLPR